MRRLLVLLAACGTSSNPIPAIDSGGEIDAPAEARPWIASVTTITGEHRAVPGAMFGGWGPHLGHLVQAQGATYWVDDLCSPAVAGDCNVDIDRRVGVFRKDAEGWTRLATIPLSGIQQNTATLADGGKLFVYGIDSGAQRIVECSYAIATGASGCTTLAIPIGAAANYIGAAVVPSGRIVWWTNVVDGGGGSFSYIVDYGGGWNGPRTGAIGGYNDCGYAHVVPRANGIEAFCQVVSGLAPNWTFATLVGTTATALSAPISWRSGLAPPAGDTIISTNDLFVDAQGTTHLLARSGNGAAVHYAKTSGDYTAVETLPATFRARWIVTDRHVALAHDVDRTRLVVDMSPEVQVEVPLPPGFGSIYAIYPLSPAYQRDAVDRIELAVVGSGEEHLALHVAIAQAR